MNSKDMKSLINKARKLAKPFRVTDAKFCLKDIDPGDTAHLTSEDKPRAKEALAMGIDVLAELQDMLYAQDNWAVGAADLSGDGRRRQRRHEQACHVRGQSQGCQVFSFKAPTSEDLDHVYL